MRGFDLTPYRRSTVGFDRLFDLIENNARLAQGDNYPPFNIERLAEDRYRVTLAVAGFRPEEIDITAQQNLLQVIGRNHDDWGLIGLAHGWDRVTGSWRRVPPLLGLSAG